MSAAQAAASGVISDLIEEIKVTHPGAIEDEPAAEAETEPEAEAEETLELDRELPDDVRAILEGDDEDEPEEPAAEVEQEQWGDYETPDEEDLRVKLHKAEKELAHVREQGLTAQRKEWRAEIAEHFALLTDEEAGQIAGWADSRRKALREAKARHDILKAGAERVNARSDAAIEKLVEERVAAERERIKQQWGSPIAGPGPAPVEAGERAELLQRIQEAPTFLERTRLKIQHKLI